MAIHSLAELPVSYSTFAEIANKLNAAGYTHAVSRPGRVDMTGIALTCDILQEPTPEARQAAGLTAHLLRDPTVLDAIKVNDPRILAAVEDLATKLQTIADKPIPGGLI